MRTRSRLLLAALASTALLAALVGAASANTLSQVEQNFRITYSPLSFVSSFGSTLRCPITLEGSVHSRTFAKTAESLIGYVTRPTIGACESGRFRFNTETLPWHVTYAGFEGTLPSITAISKHVKGMSLEIDGEIFGLSVRCRYTIASQLFIDTRESLGNVTTERPGTESIASETAGCPSFRQEGTGAVSTPTGGRIAIRLITSGGTLPSLTPSSIVEFGRAEAEGTISRTLTINANTESPRINSIRVTTGTYFAILDPNRCVGSTLAARTTCTFRAIFAAPRETERTFEDRVVVETSLNRIEDALRAST